MAYIGREPLNGFYTKQIIANDGSTTTFALTHGIASTTAIIVSVNAVILQPDVGYTISGGGTNIIFASAPNATTYIHYLGESFQQTLTDMNGVEFILDADADTSLTADTDDEIDIKVGGTDRSTIKATGFHNLDSIKFVAGTSDDMQIYHDGSNSYITNAVGALKIATETSGIAITIGHSTSEITIADNMTVAGDLTVTGTTSFADTNITNVGSIALDTITNDGTDITLDSSGDIILDAGGDTIFLKDSGTTFGSLDNSSSNLIIKSGTTTAATFSGANVTLAGTLGVGAITGTSTIQGTTITATTAFVPDASDGAALGTAALEFSDLFFADSAVLNFGDDQDTTLTHTDGTGLTLNSTNKICFNDTSQFIQGASNAILALGATDEIDLTATLVDINANVEISGTATTTGVHTFSAVPVLPANSIDSAHYVDGSIDTAHIAADNITSALIADDAIDSEHYTDGSIDNAHIADNAIDSEHYADGSIDNAHIADDQIDSEHYADGSIDTAHIADDQITLAKMASGTDGNLITYDASGNPAAVATGNDGQVLTSAGAGQPPVFETSSGISMGKAIAAAIVFG